MDDPMNRSKETHDPPNEAKPVRRSAMLCSLRIVPVSSEHFLGRRYVMELATTGRARELRVFRSMEQLMHEVEELGLRKEFRESLYLQLLDEGSCELDIVL
jgi:hypothetical protein